MQDPRPARSPATERAALLASSAVVVATMVAQAPGRIVPETKLDVLVEPVRFLGRALSAWDPSGGFGRVQNQSVGYLFPMGAFTAAGRAAHVPPWLVQRAWLALVVLAGLWGAHRLAAAIGVASPAGRLVAAWAYALAPATVATTAFQSAGQLPYAFVPWVLVPLVSAGPGASPRRVAARSGLAVACMGGVNGGATFAVLPLVAAWFLTRSPGPDRRRLAGWWVAAAVAASVWWVVPLLVSVRYGVRFTDFTETAALTTATESANEVLRGTGNWLAYLPTRSGRWLPGAYDLATHRAAIVGSTLVAAGGLLGLARSDAPHRSWLVPSALMGAVAMGIGYGGAAGGSFAPVVQHLLDGPLAPLRNVHKFAAVVRLPLALGLGHLVAVAGTGVRTPSDTPRFGAYAPNLRRFGAYAPGGGRAGPGVPRRRPPLAIAAPVAAVIAILAAIAPAVTGDLTAPGSFTDIPAAWRDATRWIDRHDGGRRTLVLPGAGFAEYRWGRPLDEPLSSLLQGNWAGRDLVPLGGDGSTRLLDGLDVALADDHLPAGFVATLRRSGVRFILVRNDLDLGRTGGPGPATMRRLLATAGGIRRVAAFGPTTDDRGADGRIGPRPGSSRPARFRQLDVYEVPGADGPISAYPAAGALVVGGGPEAMAGLPPEVLDERAVVLAVDAPAAGLARPVRVATDTARRRDVVFGAIRNNASFTLTPGERSPVTGEAPRDRWPEVQEGEPVGLSDARVQGATAIVDDAEPGDLDRAEHQPGAAFDANIATSWVPDEPTVGHWLEVRLDGDRRVPAVTVTVPSATGERVGSVTVTTTGGSRTAPIAPDGTARVATAPGETSRVRVTIASMVAGVPADPVGLAEVALDGVTVGRAVVAAPSARPGDGRSGERRSGDTNADTAWFSRLRRDQFGRFRTDEEGRLAREVRLAAGRYDLSGTASPAPGPALDRLLAPDAGSPPGRRLHATSTSTWRGLPAYQPAAAFDGDPTTTWISAPEAGAPELRLRWDGPEPVDRLVLRQAPGADQAVRVVVDVGGRRIDRSIPADGVIAIPAVRTDRLVLSFPASGPLPDEPRLVGVAEVEVPALAGRTAPRPSRSVAVEVPCGKGPSVRVDGRMVRTRATTTVGAVLDSAPVAWRSCTPVRLAAGSHRIDGPAGAPLAVDDLAVVPVGGLGDAPMADRSLDVTSWGRQHRDVRVRSGSAAIVATTENINDGWRATLDGRPLRAVRVDGWRQGWLVPAGGTATLRLDHGPGRVQRGGLAVGALALAALAGAAVWAGSGRRRGARPAGAATWAPPDERPWPEAALLVLAGMVGVALAGPAVVVLLGLLVLPRRDRWLPVVAASSALAAGVLAFASPDADITNSHGTLSAPAQLLATAAWLALATSVLGDRRPVLATRPGAGAGSTRSSRGRPSHRRRGTGTTPEGTG